MQLHNYFGVRPSMECNTQALLLIENNTYSTVASPRPLAKWYGCNKSKKCPSMQNECGRSYVECCVYSLFSPFKLLLREGPEIASNTWNIAELITWASTVLSSIILHMLYWRRNLYFSSVWAMFASRECVALNHLRCITWRNIGSKIGQTITCVNIGDSSWSPTESWGCLRQKRDWALLTEGKIIFQIGMCLLPRWRGIMLSWIDCETSVGNVLGKGI